MRIPTDVDFSAVTVLRADTFLLVSVVDLLSVEIKGKKGCSAKAGDNPTNQLWLLIELFHLKVLQSWCLSTRACQLDVTRHVLTVSHHIVFSPNEGCRPDAFHCKVPAAAQVEMSF